MRQAASARELAHEQVRVKEKHYEEDLSKSAQDPF